jgi:glycosyltransferase involved in cell wall biosynthesis
MSNLDNIFSQDLMPEKTPLVSVLLCVFNAEDYLGEAIESIIQQTFIDFEFIILNDGSKDNSLKIIEEHAAKDSRIKVISRENRGIVSSRNELLIASRGHYVAVMDADDIALPNRLQLQVQYLDNHPEVLGLGGDYHVIDSKGRHLTTFSLPESNDEIQKMMLVGHTAILHPTSLFRRNAIRAIGDYDPDFELVEDLDLWLRLSEKGQIANLKKVVLKYRLHGNSISEKNGLKQRENGRRACEAAWKRRGISEKYKADSAWRPTSAKDSRHEFMLRYGWWAWNSCQRWTAFIYGLKAIRVKPFNDLSWKLFLSAGFKPLKSNSRLIDLGKS